MNPNGGKLFASGRTRAEKASEVSTHIIICFETFDANRYAQQFSNTLSHARVRLQPHHAQRHGSQADSSCMWLGAVHAVCGA